MNKEQLYYAAIAADNNSPIWWCTSTTEVKGEKYDFSKDSSKALELTARKASILNNYYQSLGYKASIIKIAQ